jgi:hypothetical protein
MEDQFKTNKNIFKVTETVNPTNSNHNINTNDNNIFSYNSKLPELENKKLQIISRFYNRPKVNTYLTLLSENSNMINPKWKNKISNVSEEVKEDISDLFRLYTIKIEPLYLYQNILTSHDFWEYECSALQDNDLDFFLPIFFQEFSLYPISLVSKSKLKSIFFCHSLKFSTENYSQYRAAVPDYTDNIMSMIYCCKETSVKYIRNVIHHEFFHFLDYVEDGKIYGKDLEWESFNLIDFEYGKGGCYERQWKPLANDKKEFLNFYSTTGVEEDKAEIFSFMMLKCRKVQDVQNENLKKKFENIKSMMKKFDKEGFGSEKFWQVFLRLREEIDNFGVY